MSAKTGCICLLLILVSAWAHELKAGTFAVQSQNSPPVFGQEVFPFSMKRAAEIRDSIELPPQELTDFTILANLSFSPPALNSFGLDEQDPAVRSGADIRYLLVALQP
jgi:hypothetical protein